MVKKNLHIEDSVSAKARSACRAQGQVNAQESEDIPARMQSKAPCRQLALLLLLML